MGTIECSQPASKYSWDSQDFGDINMVLKMDHIRKSTGHDELRSPSSLIYGVCWYAGDNPWQMGGTSRTYNEFELQIFFSIFFFIYVKNEHASQKWK